MQILLKMLCSPASASFAVISFLTFNFCLYGKSCTSGAYTVYMFLTIGACARVGYSSRVWSEAEAPENVPRTSVLNEIHTMHAYLKLL